MLTPYATQIALSVLAAGGAGALALAMFYPYLARDRQSELRRKAIVQGYRAGTRAAAAMSGSRSGSKSGAKPGDSRKRSLEEVLREIEEKQRAKQRSKPTLQLRMRQAGLSWSKSTYFAVCLATGLACCLAAFAVVKLGALPSLGFGVAGGLLLPHFYVNRKRARRIKLFTAEFANAMDIIVRGLRAGLPLADCMKIIAAEAQEPVRSEFKSIIQDQAMGMPADEAVQRLPGRMPITEANFFAIVISIQSRTGGSLSEALGNLSKVLRERKKMRAKILAMSSEAKSSAMIIGAMPVFVIGAIYLTTPEYISLLFTTTAGNTILALAGFWMLIGVLVMRKMINFDF